jgi:uncharacterized protein YbjT (DUF2867 family)
MAHREREPMGRVRQARVTTTDRKRVAVTVEYEGGFTHVILADVSMPSPSDPAAAKIQVANQLKTLGTDLTHIEPDRIVIEWPSG